MVIVKMKCVFYWCYINNYFQPVVWSGHFSRTSGDRKPGVPALGAACPLLDVHTWQTFSSPKQPQVFMDVDRPELSLVIPGRCCCVCFVAQTAGFLAKAIFWLKIWGLWKLFTKGTPFGFWGRVRLKVFGSSSVSRGMVSEGLRFITLVFSVGVTCPVILKRNVNSF